MSWSKTGRREPYTEAGIKRVGCVRCGEQADSQWQVCADQSRYRALCSNCDLALNRLVLEWAGDPWADVKLKRYEAKNGRTQGRD